MTPPKWLKDFADEVGGVIHESRVHPEDEEYWQDSHQVQDKIEAQRRLKEKLRDRIIADNYSDTDE